MRTCKKCGGLKPLVEFVKNKKCANGFEHTCKECKKSYDVKYRKENWEHLYRGMKIWASENPQVVSEITSRSKKKHSGRRNAEWHARYAKQKGNGGSFTDEEWTALCKKYDGTCLACKKRKPLTKDHVVPIVLGGRNDISNLQPLCQSCNSRKNKNIVDYR